MVIASFIVPESIPITQATLICQSPRLVIKGMSSAKKSSCPCCHRSSRSIHSHYERIFSDLPVSGKEVKVVLDTRRFFCKNSKCKRKIFSERFDSQILPYGRSFIRSVDLVRKLGLELGGNKTSIICKAMGYSISSSSVLRNIKRIELPQVTKTSGIIGVDDWAYKKGRNYGTIIVDLERKKVIDLLPDREADTLASWLLNHPEIHTVARDRASAYALGIRAGAPQAIQVADRFHLLVNLTSAFQRSLYKHSKLIKDSFHAYNNIDEQIGRSDDSQVNSRHDEANVEMSQAVPNEKNDMFEGNVSAERQYKFQKAKELHQQGYGIKTIARKLKAGRKTIRKYITMDSLRGRENPVSIQSTNLSKFESLLLNSYLPTTTYLALFNHIVTLGFNGKYTQFCERMNRLINDGKTAKTRSKDHLPKLKPANTWSTSKLAFMILYKGQLKDNDKQFIEFLFTKSREIRNTARLANSFRELFAEKNEGSLLDWIEKASAGDSGLRNFAKGISLDFNAINQAVISSFSSGQVEGQVNKLKTIKRKMYGRAGFHLLKKMVLANSCQIIHQM